MSDSYESDEFEEVEEQEEVEEEIQEEVKDDKKRSHHIDFEKDFEGVSPDVVKKFRGRVDEDFRKIKTFEQQQKDSQRKIRELESQMLKLKKPRAVELPSADLAISDPEEFTRQQTAYSQNIKDLAEYEYQLKEREALAEAERQREIENQRATFYERATNAGVDPLTAHTAANIALRELPEGLHEMLADNPRLLVKVASDAVEMQNLKSLPIAAAVLKLDKMAQSFKKSTKSNAPPPDDPIKGGSVPRKDLGPEGATYE